MKRLMICLLCIFVLTVSCTKYIKPQETEISDNLLDDLSSDLAEINVMVENANKEYKEELTMVKVLEPWTKRPGGKFSISTATRKEVYDVLAKSTIKAPTVKGYTVVEIFKLKGRKEEFIGVTGPETFGDMQLSASKVSRAGGYPIKFYDSALAYDQKAYEAITKYVSFTSRLERTAKKILKKLAEFKKKYMESPIYIEGFTIHLPVISIDIQFKFKS